MYTGTVAISHQQTQTIQFASYKYAVRRIGTKRRGTKLIHELYVITLTKEKVQHSK